MGSSPIVDSFRRATRPERPPQTSETPRLGDGEIHFLWWFMQGSIMNRETREALRAAWGMCERHAAGLLATECAFRHGWVHASTLLYADLAERGIAALSAGGPLAELRVARGLRERGPCLMCAGGYGSESLSPPRSFLTEGADLSGFRALLARTRDHWLRYVCPVCTGGGEGTLCRRHLREGLPGASLPEARAALGAITRHMIRYARSFRWEDRDSETVADQAGLVAAVGWCSGWRALLSWSVDRA